jgi:hypothetical protein
MNEVTAAYLKLAADGSPFDGLMDRAAIPEEIRTRKVRGLLNRPLFLPAEKAVRAGTDMRLLFDLLVSLPDRLFDGDFARYGSALGLTGEQIEVATRGRMEPLRVFGRGDFYLHRGELKLLEFNLGSSIAGMDWVEINQALLAVPEFGRFAEEHSLGFSDPLARIADELRRYLGTTGTGDRPVVVLTAWPGPYERFVDSFRFLAKLLSGPDLDVRTCPLGELRTPRDGVTLHGTKVDGLYRFFGLKEIIGAADGYRLVEPLLRAHEAGTTRMFLPLEYSLYSNKRALAMLSDERNREAFSRAELDLVDRILPWSRPLVAGLVQTPDGLADLQEYCQARQRELIVKPSSGFRSEGIVAGWACDERTWRETLNSSISHNYVVQQRISPDPEPFGRPAGQQAGDFAINWGLYVIGDGYAGGMTRGLPAENDPIIGGAEMFIGCLFHICTHMSQSSTEVGCQR